jgi:hypothetical protein
MPHLLLHSSTCVDAFLSTSPHDALIADSVTPAALATDSKVTVAGRGVEFTDRPDGLAAGQLVPLAGGGDQVRCVVSVHPLTVTEISKLLGHFSISITSRYLNMTNDAGHRGLEKADLSELDV